MEKGLETGKKGSHQKADTIGQVRAMVSGAADSSEDGGSRQPGGDSEGRAH